ncbi:MAG: hypothetical protein DWQ08_11255 [Proteobacteria bacterium]|nr:MAG: hypothetical protein DWQ08_11255 [Pseudomonadota bacterium]
MTKILFAWEMGVGYGHIMPYLDLVRRLTATGHSVSFATRDLSNTYDVFEGEKVEYIQAPALYGRSKHVRFPGHSYIDVLYNTGFADVNHFKGRILAWRSIFEKVKPDVVIFDGAPSANLVARRFDCARITSGTGFFVPPSVTPPPSLRFWLKKDPPVADHEQELVKNVNASLAAIGDPEIEAAHELVACDDQFLMNFPELDHYPSRMGADYIGTFPPIDYGTVHEWPSLSGKKVFAYLYPFKTLPSLFQAMEKLNVSATIYAPKVPQKMKDENASERVRFVDTPASMNKIMEECDVAITNGNLSSSASVLLAGKPLLLLPTTLERQIVARRVHELGAGLAAPQLKPGGMAMKFEALLKDSRYTDRAVSFSERYADRNKTWQVDRMVEKTEALLGRRNAA